MSKMLSDITDWVEGGGWLTATARNAQKRRKRPIEDFASTELSRRRRKVRRRIKEFDSLDVGERHRLRIAVKKLRYAAEFLAPVFRSSELAKKRSKALQSTLADAQDWLGELNDIAVAAMMTKRFRVPRKTGKLLAARGGLQPEQRLALAKRALSAVAESEPFWR